jgi:hypothetical protein
MVVIFSKMAAKMPKIQVFLLLVTNKIWYLVRINFRWQFRNKAGVLLVEVDEDERGQDKQTAYAVAPEGSRRA